MAEAAETLHRIVGQRGRGDLDSDVVLCLAVVRAIEILGEAASRVSAETKSGVPAILEPRLWACAPD